MNIADEHVALIHTAICASGSDNTTLLLYQFIDFGMTDNLSAKPVDVVHQSVDNQMTATP